MVKPTKYVRGSSAPSSAGAVTATASASSLRCLWSASSEVSWSESVSDRWQEPRAVDSGDGSLQRFDLDADLAQRRLECFDPVDVDAPARDAERFQVDLLQLGGQDPARLGTLRCEFGRDLVMLGDTRHPAGDGGDGRVDATVGGVEGRGRSFEGGAGCRDVAVSERVEAVPGVVGGVSDIVHGDVAEHGERERADERQCGRGADHDGHANAGASSAPEESDGADVGGQHREHDRGRSEDDPEFAAGGDVECEADQDGVDDASLFRLDGYHEADHGGDQTDHGADDRPRQHPGGEGDHRRVPAHGGGSEPGDAGDGDEGQDAVDGRVAGGGCGAQRGHEPGEEGDRRDGPTGSPGRPGSRRCRRSCRRFCRRWGRGRSARGVRGVDARR